MGGLSIGSAKDKRRDGSVLVSMIWVCVFIHNSERKKVKTWSLYDPGFLMPATFFSSPELAERGRLPLTVSERSLPSSRSLD